MDREIVKTHLQIIHTWSEFARERDLQFFTAKHLEDIAQWAYDAITLLNDCDTQIQYRDDHIAMYQAEINRLEALLKEQEAVKPKSKVRHGANGQIQHWCGNCMTMLHGKQKFCSECGRAVNWE